MAPRVSAPPRLMVSRRHESTGRLTLPIFLHRGGIALLMLAAFEPLTGCMDAVAPRAAIAYTGDPIVDGNAELVAAPPKDRVLWDDRVAATALRLGNFDEAKAKLDDAILRGGGIINNTADAAKARSFFHPEDTKTFIGEPYERVMDYYYRAIIYWRDGEPDNARACYRTGQLLDSDPDAHQYQSDYVLLDYLDGLASEKLGEDGSDALARAQALTKRHLPPYSKNANVLVFAEYGQGPVKYAGGEYGEQLRFYTEESRIHSARLIVDGRKTPLPPYDNLNFQATTRGGRVMDHILGNKAVFKGTTNTVGNVALIGAAVAANNGSRDGNDAALGLAAIGILSKITSAATTAQADIRAWDNLPQYLSFASLKLAPGDHSAQIEFLTRDGDPAPELTREITITVPSDPSANTVVFLSELPR
jgi:tetratricopeptide (TPR) repeat protein